MHKLMPKTTEIVLRSFVEAHMRGEPMVWCVNGVACPKNKKLLDRILRDGKAKQKRKRVSALPLSRSACLASNAWSDVEVSGLDSEEKLQEWVRATQEKDMKRKRRLRRLFGKSSSDKSEVRSRKLLEAKLYAMAKQANYTVQPGTEWKFLPYVRKLR